MVSILVSREVEPRVQALPALPTGSVFAVVYPPAAKALEVPLQGIGRSQKCGAREGDPRSITAAAAHATSAASGRRSALGRRRPGRPGGRPDRRDVPARSSAHDGRLNVVPRPPAVPDEIAEDVPRQPGVDP